MDPHLYEAIGAAREHLHRKQAPVTGHPTELDVERAQAAEHPDDHAPDEIDVHATPLEKDGWVLHCETRQERLAHGILSEMERLQELLDAGEEIDAYRRGERTEADVEQARKRLHTD